jgi:hypothetical protein
MDCRTVKDRLMRSERDGEAAAHLDACPECAAFARRLALAREALGEPAAPADAMEPDASFALRVVQRLPRPAEVLGWAALRSLPADAVLTYAALAPEAGP